MTPQELHSRILLHELRTILLDETREGGQIPERFKEAIRGDPHNPGVYQIVADWLDDQGDPLGELCRIQVELIGKLEPEYWGRGPLNEPRLSQHPFETDRGSALVTQHSYEWPIELLERRWEITRELYQNKCPWDNNNDGDCIKHPYPPGCPRTKLGRTTRMLTDVLRYCALNEGKQKMVLVIHPDSNLARQQFDRTFQEIIGEQVGEHLPIQEQNRRAFGTPIFFEPPYGQGETYTRFHVPQDNADITFTDHACPTLTERLVRSMQRTFGDSLNEPLFNIPELDNTP